MTLVAPSLGCVEGGGHLQCLTLLLLNAGETVLRSLASFGVCHTEHVVSFDTTHHTWVTGDGRSKHKTFRFVLNTVECVNGLCFSLIFSTCLLLCGGLCNGRVFNVGVLTSKEGVHRGWWNWLLQKNKKFKTEEWKNLLYCSGGSRAGHQRFGLQSRVKHLSD